jgi:hypothetical protein
MRLLLICIAIVGIRIVLDGALRHASIGETVSNSFWFPLLRLALVDFVYFSLAAAIALFAFRLKAITSVMLGGLAFRDVNGTFLERSRLCRRVYAIRWFVPWNRFWLERGKVGGNA